MNRNLFLAFLLFTSLAIVAFGGTGGSTVSPPVITTTDLTNSTASTTTIIPSVTGSTTITALTSRRSISLVATGTFLVTIGSTTVNSAAIPVTTFGADLDAAVPISVQSYLATTSITVYQVAR